MAQHTYRDFAVGTFERERDQCHARVRRSDNEAFVLDGIHLRDVDIGVAWPTADEAFKDSCFSSIGRSAPARGKEPPSCTVSGLPRK